jgi:predicted dehydrogenase
LAVFGGGKAARFHLDAMALIEGVELCGVCTPSGDSARRLAEGHPGAIHTDEPRMLLETSPDAALVAVPAAASPELIRDLLSAGVPVLAEKPAAPSSAEVDDLAELASRTGTLAAVAVNRRYYSLVLQALHAVRERGPVRAVLVEGHEPLQTLMRSGNVDAATAAHWHLLNSVHFVDLLRLVGGDVVSFDVRSSGAPAPDRCVSASMEFDSGAVGTYVASWNCASSPSMKIYGDEVTAEVELGQPESAFLRFAGRRRVKLHPDDADQSAKPGVLDQDAAFLHAVSAGRPSVPFPASDLADHARSLRLTEQIFATSTAAAAAQD